MSTIIINDLTACIQGEVIDGVRRMRDVYEEHIDRLQEVISKQDALILEQSDLIAMLRGKLQ